jgi:hypothetical protein
LLDPVHSQYYNVASYRIGLEECQITNTLRCENMKRQQDIEFLETFRQKVRDYLFLGYAPVEGTEESRTMREALDKPSFQQLRREINEMKWRADQLLSEFNIAIIVVQYPPPAIGGPVLEFNLLDLITENRSARSLDIESITDKIDQVIGILKHQPEPDAKTLEPPTPTFKVNKGFVFIAMPMDVEDPALEDVHQTIKEVALSVGLVAERVDEPATTERITDRVLESLCRAEFVVADLTHSKPNVYYEAGYAHALGKVPIYIAREGTIIEFDLKDYPVIFFPNMKKLKAELTKRLSGLLKKRNQK